MGYWTQVLPQLTPWAFVSCMTSINGDVYAGAYTYADNTGGLLKWDGTASTWTELARINTESILSIANYNNKIYVGTYPSAKLYEYDGTSTLVQKATQPSGGTYCWDLVSYNNKLYGGIGVDKATGLTEWDGTSAWIVKAGSPTANRQVYCITVHDNSIFCGAEDPGGAYRWDDASSWIEVAGGTGHTIRKLLSADGVLYGTDYYNLLQWDNVSAWITAATAATTASCPDFLNSMAKHKNMIYVGGYGNIEGVRTGSLFQWNNRDFLIKCAQDYLSQIMILALLSSGTILYGSTGINGYLLKYVETEDTWFGVDF
jgi:hypothetical protein